MFKFIISEVQLGIVQFDWTMVFQLLNTALWILIIYAIYTYFRKSKTKQKNLEDRVTRLEKEVENLTNQK